MIPISQYLPNISFRMEVIDTKMSLKGENITFYGRIMRCQFVEAEHSPFHSGNLRNIVTHCMYTPKGPFKKYVTGLPPIF